ncbi:PAS domain S-box protein, partial [Chloroflexota bacterium]
FANKAFLRYHGMTSDQVVGHTVAELLGEEVFITTVKLNVDRCLQGEMIKYEMKHHYPELDERYLEVLYYPLKSDGKESKGVVAIIRDITERKQAENELRKFKTISDKAGYGVTIVDLEGNSIYANESYARIHGHTPEELVGKHISIFHTEQQMAHVNRLIEQLNREGSYVAEEVWRKRKDNTEFPTLMSGTLIRDENGAPLFMAGTAIDITERKRAEEKIRESEEKFRSIVENSSDQIFMLNKDYKFLSINKTAADISKMSPQEMIGMSILTLFPEETAARFSKNIKNVFDTGKSVFIEEKMLAQGREFYNSTSLNPVRDDKGDVIAVTGIVRDITEHKQAEEKLRESEEKLRLMFEAIPEGITVVGIDGKILQSNKASAHMYGYDNKEEIIGLSIFELVAKKDHTRVTEIMKNTLKEEALGAIELTQLRKDRSEFPAELSGTILKDASGNPTGFLTIMEDITERKQAEDILRMSESDLAEAQELAHVGNWRWEIIPDKVYWSDEARRLFGVEPGEAINYAKYLSIVLPEDRDFIMKEVQDALNGIKPYDNEHRIVRNGEIRTHHTKGTVTQDEQGKPIRLFGVVQDITERKQTENKLHEEQKRLKEAQALGRIGSWEYDVDSQGIIWADETYVLYERDPALGPPTAEEEAKYYPAKQAEILRSYAARSIKNREEFRYDVEVILPGGRKGLFTCAMRPIMNESGRVITLFGIVQDITERKQLEAERQRIEKLESIGTLAAGIAHDFNNLLTGIMGNISLAKRHVEPEGKAFERLGEAEKASVRARDLNQQLLTFARGGAPIRKTISIGDLIQESANFALRGSKVRPEFSLPDDLWTVEADEGQINQVISNIVINANQAMLQGGVINIEAKNLVIKIRKALPLPIGKYVEIAIKDQGGGISEKDLARIFDPFFSTKQKGSGLGLATAYSIINNHGGYITLESKLGVGTTLYVYLPASKVKTPVEEEVIKETVLVGTGKILVMDDQETVRELLHAELTEVGHEVVLTSDGAEVIEKYIEARESGQPFDVVIMDLTIPGGMGGKEAIQKLLEVDPDVKAIASSGYATDPIMSEYKKYGFSAVIPKPYSVNQLEKTLRSLLKEKN